MKRFLALTSGALLLAACSTFSQRAPATYMVFFTSGNTELSADARAVIDRAASTIRGTHPQTVMIAAGVSSGDNLKLAEPRFLAVRQALIADGVADDLIARTALSDASLSVGATGDQRVEIELSARPAT